jgi:endonuclease-3
MESRQIARRGRTAKPIRVLELVRKAVSEHTALGNISSEQDSTPFKVLISTILSARTTDPVTEAAAARLFRKYPDSRALSRARRDSVAKLIKPVNFYRGKAGRIIQVAKIIEEKYRGVVPEDMDKLLELPGVGRKTANCVLVYAFKTAAIPVDVHVHRISNRIGLVRTKSPERTEEQLSELYDRRYWIDINELFVRFGQTICKPVVPRCGICSVKGLCDYYKTEVKPGLKPSSN